MEHKEKLNAIQFIRPNAQFVLRGMDLEWLDSEQIEPTQKEIEAGLIAFNNAQEAEAQAKATAKSELFDRLGITADEAKLLLG